MTALAIGTAFWLGLLTAISPCPLATNIAAISFIGRHVGNRRGVLASGLLYTLGRTLTYVALGALLAGGLLAVAEVSRFLQKYMNEILGPVMILLGMVLLGWIGSGLSMNLAGQRVQERAAKGGILWAGLLGILIAFSAEYLGKAFNRLTQLEKWVRLVAGVLFVLVGVYYSLTHIYGLSLRAD